MLIFFVWMIFLGGGLNLFFVLIFLKEFVFWFFDCILFLFFDMEFCIDDFLFLLGYLFGLNILVLNLLNFDSCDNLMMDFDLFFGCLEEFLILVFLLLLI